MIGNRPVEPYIASHRYLELASSTKAQISPAADIEALPLRAFTLDQHWQRGGYSNSLYADTDAASLVWRDDYLRDRLPMLRFTDYRLLGDSAVLSAKSTPPLHAGLLNFGSTARCSKASGQV